MLMYLFTTGQLNYRENKTFPRLKYYEILYFCRALKRVVSEPGAAMPPPPPPPPPEDLSLTSSSDNSIQINRPEPDVKVQTSESQSSADSSGTDDVSTLRGSSSCPSDSTDATTTGKHHGNSRQYGSCPNIQEIKFSNLGSSSVLLHNLDQTKNLTQSSLPSVDIAVTDSALINKPIFGMIYLKLDRSQGTLITSLLIC